MKVLIVDQDEHQRNQLSYLLMQRGVEVVSNPIISPNKSICPNDFDLALILNQEDEMLIHQVRHLLSNQNLMVITDKESLTSLYHQGLLIHTNHNQVKETVLAQLDVIQNEKMQQHFSASLKSMPIVQDVSSKATFAIARRVAKTQVTVMITGETGVGKEILARYIHQHSHHPQGPFISVNCAAMPENMVEAILFGYEKGSFTNALTAYAGKFEQAHQGTLLLDEIAEISLSLQAKLLRVIQEREVERLGSKKPIQVNVRLIAATNRDLAKQVKLGLFRRDLYYRLNVMPIHFSPLRVRQDDILPLAHYFLDRYSADFKRPRPMLSTGAQKKLLHYAWPGNIRELENLIQRTLIMCEKDLIDEQDIDFENLIEDQNLLHCAEKKLKQLSNEDEAKVIIDTLYESQGSRIETARKLNMSPRTLRYKISKLKLIGMEVP